MVQTGALIGVVYQGLNQKNQDSIKAWLKHEEPNSTKGRTRQQQEVVNQIPSSSPSEYKSNQIKSNHFYCHITTAQVPW